MYQARHSQTSWLLTNQSLKLSVPPRSQRLPRLMSFARAVLCSIAVLSFYCYQEWSGDANVHVKSSWVFFSPAITQLNYATQGNIMTFWIDNYNVITEFRNSNTSHACTHITNFMWLLLPTLLPVHMSFLVYLSGQSPGLSVQSRSEINMRYSFWKKKTQHSENGTQSGAYPNQGPTVPLNSLIKPCPISNLIALDHS